ncbi:MAG: lysophospholipase-like family protein, partial [uncultured Thermomicrobiales bacterium]
ERDPAGGCGLRGRRRQGDRVGRRAGRGRGTWLPVGERRRDVSGCDRRRPRRGRVQRRRDQGEDGYARLPGFPRPELVGGPARCLHRQPRTGEGHLRGRRLRATDAGVPAREGRPHLRRPPGSGRRGRALPVPTPGGRLRREQRPDGAVPAARRQLRDRPGPARGREGRPDEHEHPVPVRAGPAAPPARCRGGGQLHRRWGRAEQLPGLAVRRPRWRATGVADLRLPPGRAGTGQHGTQPHQWPGRAADPDRADGAGSPQRVGHPGRRELGPDDRHPDAGRGHHRLRPGRREERRALRVGSGCRPYVLRYLGLRRLRDALPRAPLQSPGPDRDGAGAVARDV